MDNVSYSLQNPPAPLSLGKKRVLFDGRTHHEFAAMKTATAYNEYPRTSRSEITGPLLHRFAFWDSPAAIL
jgi:hypothetical protein